MAFQDPFQLKPFCDINHNSTAAYQGPEKDSATGCSAPFIL